MATGRGFFRVLAVVNLVEGLADIVFSAQAISLFYHHRSLFDQEHAVAWAVYCRLGLGILFSSGLIGSVPLLWRSRRSGIQMTVGILAAELLYFLAVTMMLTWNVLSTGPHSFASVMSDTSGIGNIGIGVQLLTAYPIIALVLAFLAWKSPGPLNPEGSQRS